MMVNQMDKISESEMESRIISCFLRHQLFFWVLPPASVSLSTGPYHGLWYIHTILTIQLLLGEGSAQLTGLLLRNLILSYYIGETLLITIYIYIYIYIPMVQVKS